MELIFKMETRQITYQKIINTLAQKPLSFVRKIGALNNGGISLIGHNTSAMISTFENNIDMEDYYFEDIVPNFKVFESFGVFFQCDYMAEKSWLEEAFLMTQYFMRMDDANCGLDSYSSVGEVFIRKDGEIIFTKHPEADDFLEYKHLITEIS